MNVGDLVTLSASGKNTGRVLNQHQNYFRLNKGQDYYALTSDARAHKKAQFNDYWYNQKMVGLITKIHRDPIQYYDYAREQYAQVGEKVTYWVAWQANPKPMKVDGHGRSHLKFVKRLKK